MPTDADFLRAIADSPDDEAARLVFADWLEEDGRHELAGFVRLDARLRFLREPEGISPELLDDWSGALEKLPAGWSENFLPLTVDPPGLGPLEWDERLAWWVGAEFEVLPGHRVEIFVGFEEGTLGGVLARASAALGRLRDREAEYRRWTADDLLGRRWNTDEPMTAGDIFELLEVASVNLREGGEFEVYWDDEDVLFYGHNVVTDIDADGRCVQVRIEG